MKRNILLNSFLLLVVSFFLFAFNVNAEKVTTIKYDESVDVAKELGREGKTVTRINDATTSALDMSGCAEGGTGCVVKLRKDSGLWLISAHVIVTFEGDSTPLTLTLNIVNYWPALVSLGNYHEKSEFSYDARWSDKLTLAKANGLALESTTREELKLPTLTGNALTNAHNGLPIKFVGFIEMVREDQVTGYGSTLVVTIPVQKPGMCEKGGYLDGDIGAYGTFKEAGANVNGTGPEVYVSCYEYRDFVRLDLGGGRFVDWDEENETSAIATSLGWKYDDRTNSFINATDGALPTLPNSEQVVFPYGLTTIKRVVSWSNQDGKAYSAELFQLNGDVWSPGWDFDPSSASTNDKVVGLRRTITISSSASEVKKCEGGSKYVSVSGPNEEGKCEITGLLYEDGNVTVVKVTYKDGDPVEYNVRVENSAESGEITLIDIELEDLQDEDPGEGDIIWKTCKTYNTAHFMAWGSWGVTKGTSLNRSVYQAQCATPEVGAWSTGYCIDPSAPAPAGTYIRDTSWDKLLTQPNFVEMVSEIEADVESCGESWNAKDTGHKCQDQREGAQVAFRLLSVSLNMSWNFSGHSDYNIYSNAANLLGEHPTKDSIENALKYIFSGDHSSSNHAYEAAQRYLEAYINGGEDTGYDITDFKITKSTEYSQISNKEYYLYYSGKIITPIGIELSTSDLPETNSTFESKYGYSVKMTKLEKAKDGEYSYEATLHVKDASPDKLKVPTSKEDKEEAAKYFELKISTGAIRDILVIKPQSGAHLQRLLLYDKGTRSLTVFFGPDYTDQFCGDEGKLDATMLETCEADAKAKTPHYGSDGVVANDESATCNYKLFRQCCKIVDEGSYPVSFFNICTNTCSYNTLGSVCGFVEYGARKGDQATLYHVREGYQTIGSSADAKTFQKNINICVADVRNYADTNPKSDFKKNDGAGNPLNVEAYEGNKYCQVTCREEWDMTMGSFGSYMGAESVRAGGSFQLDKADLFIRGDRYCYTSYLDTDSDNKYYSDMKGYASSQRAAFDVYSKAAHEYADLTKADNTLTDAFGVSGSVTQIDATGQTRGHLDANQACKKWTKVYYTPLKEAKKKYSCPSGWWHTSNAYSNSCTTTISSSSTDYSKCGNSSYPSYYFYNNVCYHDSNNGSYDGWDFEYEDKTSDNSTDMGYECTTKDIRKPDCSGTSSGYTCEDDDAKKEEYYKDEAISISFYGAFELTGKFDGGCGAGKYKTSGGCGGSYDTYPEQAECKIVFQSHSKPDKVTCSYGDITSPEWDAKTEDLVKEINKLSIGDETLKSGMKMSTAGDSKFVGEYYSKLKDDLEKNIHTARATIVDEEGKMHAAANQWYQCQNFVLYTKNYTGTNVNDYNESDLSSYGLSSQFTALGSPGTPVQIYTSFEPKVSYYYDEEEYMQLLQHEEKLNVSEDHPDGIQGNVLERNDFKNTAIFDDVSELKVNVDDKNKFFDPKNPNVNLGYSKKIKLALNASELESEGATDSERDNELNISKKSYKFMKASSAWTGENARTYGETVAASTPEAPKNDWDISICTIGSYSSTDGTSTPYTAITTNSYAWEGGGCYAAHLWYYDNANYIERSVSNSSFFKNKGDWYAKGNAFTTHGDVLESGVSDAVSAIEVYNSFHSTNISSTNPEELKQWHFLGSKNVFPVSITTPRNLYKYTYVFTQIGSYNQKVKTSTNSLGRLMGNANSVFRSNSRTCFYEVLEALCKCCADESYNHVVNPPSTVDENVTKRYAENHEEKLGKIMSDDDKISVNNQGQIGFYNTVSSLANLSAIADDNTKRDLAANWTETAVFNYNGYNRYVTNKGEVAQRAIEAVGEEVYSPTYSAEYAYTLTPEAIAHIRQNNKITSYGVTFDTDHVRMYGKAKIATDGSSSDITSDTTEAVKMNKEITFEHYGSVFLEETVAGYAKPDSDDGTFKNLNLASKKDVCYINEDNEVDGKDGKAVAASIKEKMEKDGCRWVDYLENDGEANANYMNDYYDGKKNCDEISDDGLKNVCVADYRVQSTFRLAFK